MKKPLTKAEKKRIIKTVDKWGKEHGHELVLLGLVDESHEFAEAILGVQELPKPAVIYHYDTVIECFMRMNDWDYEEAVEWYDFNVARATPYYDDQPVFRRTKRLHKRMTDVSKLVG